MFCMACGQELPEEAAFCWKCGRAVGSSETLRADKPSIVELRCPKCAGKLDVSSDMSKLTCASCASELLIVRDDKTVTVRDERSEAAERLSDLCKRIIAEYVRTGEPSVQVLGVDEDPTTLVRALRRAVLAEAIGDVYVVHRYGGVYLSRKPG